MKIEPTLTTVQRALFLITEVETFKPVVSDEVAAIAARMSEMRFPAGHIVYERYDPEARMFVIVDGAIERMRDGRVYHTATRGMLFGFFAVTNEDYDETIRTARETHVLVLSQEDFIDAVADSPSFALGLIRGLTRTIVMSSRRLEQKERELAEALRMASSSDMMPMK